MDSQLKVLVVEDDAGVRDATVEYLSGHNMELAEADSYETCLQVIEKFTPDIAVMDIVLPEKSKQRAEFKKHIGVDIARDLYQRFPGIGIVFLTHFIDQAHEVLKMSMDGHDRIVYLSKGSLPQELLRAIQQLGQGIVGLDLVLRPQRSTAFDQVLRLLTPAERDALMQALDEVPNLSDAEQKVFNEIGSCSTHQEAATELCIVEKTISSHMEKIYDKLQLRSAAGLNPLLLLAKLHLLYSLQLDLKKENIK